MRSARYQPPSPAAIARFRRRTLIFPIRDTTPPTAATAAAALALLLPSLADATDPPTWLWTQDEGAEPRVLRHEFGLDSVPEDSTLKATADFAALTVRVNGTIVGTLEPYDPVTEFPVDSSLVTGLNEIEIEAVPVDGPSAVAAEMRFVEDTGEKRRIGTDPDTWSGESIIGKGRVLPPRWAPNRLPEISPSAEYNQWKEALDDGAAQTLSPPPEGFRLSTVHEAAGDEGSWVSLAIDPQGRLVVAKERKGLLRLTPSKDGLDVRKVEVIDDEMKECRGLAFHDGALYANANDSKTLYRLRDTTGDGRFDEKVAIGSTAGKTGHGRNDLAVGPGDAIHAIHGDSVETLDRTRFLTVPEPGGSEPLGHWVTIGEDDSAWTLLARGLRNPYGIAFNRHGEAFTYDADNEGDVGLPFYRPSRINHLVVGANYGWHQRPGNTRSLPVYAPDSVPSTFDVGRGSPTAVKFGYRSDFPEPWRSALFALDWAYGRILAIHLVPRGASYYAGGEVFLEGRPLNVTDLDFDEGGNLYFVTGGRKTRSALYRLAWNGERSAVGAEASSTQSTARAEFSARRRAIRRHLERSDDPVTPDSDSWSFLDSADPWLRNAARVALERRPLEEWRATALHRNAADISSRAQLVGLLSLARQGNADDRLAALEAALPLSGENLRRETKLVFLRIAELSLAPDTPEAVERRVGERATAWLTKPAAPVSREAVRVLARLDAPAAVEMGLALMTQSRTQEDRLHYLEMLSRAKAGWTEERRSVYFKALALARGTSQGDRFMPPFFEAVEQEALANVPADERETFRSLLQREQPGAPENPVPTREFVKHWTLADFPSGTFSGETRAVPDEKGESLFRAGLCHHCHTVGSLGEPVGPDLSTVGRRFAPHDLLRSILQPSAVVSEVYRTVSVEKRDGSTLTGRLVRDDFRQSMLYLSTQPFAPGELTRIPKDEVEEMKPSEVSPMPPGLLSGFTKKEIVALVRWLVDGA